MFTSRTISTLTVIVSIDSYCQISGTSVICVIRLIVNFNIKGLRTLRQVMHTCLGDNRWLVFQNDWEHKCRNTNAGREVIYGQKMVITFRDVEHIFQCLHMYGIMWLEAIMQGSQNPWKLVNLRERKGLESFYYFYFIPFYFENRHKQTGQWKGLNRYISFLKKLLHCLLSQ